MEISSVSQGARLLAFSRETRLVAVFGRALSLQAVKESPDEEDYLSYLSLNQPIIRTVACSATSARLRSSSSSFHSSW